MSNIDRFSNKVAPGSIWDMANTRGEKPANLLAEADVVVMLDISGSMTGSKYDRAIEALRDIQRTFPGRVALIEFNDLARLNLSGHPSYPGGSTSMHLALSLAKEFDGTGTRFYLISDGQPTGSSEGELLSIAESFTDRIYTIFIGEDWDTGGQDILRKISDITGGSTAGRVDPAMLGEAIMGLLKEG